MQQYEIKLRGSILKKRSTDLRMVPKSTIVSIGKQIQQLEKIEVLLLDNRKYKKLLDK
jgi:hypothetical protein